jgi:hypothetical protein
MCGGWGVCVGDDWLLKCAPRFPSKPVQINKFRQRVACFGARLPPMLPAGIYTPRLIAIAQALLCVPSSWDISVYSVKGPIDAMAWFRKADTDRHKLRMCASAVLQFIEQAVQARAQVGGSTSFVAYGNNDYDADAKLERAGKRMATFCAEWFAYARSNPVCALPPQAAAPFLAVLVDNRKPIVGHTRKQLRKLDQQDVLHRWALSRSQATFSSPAAEPFVSYVRELVASRALRHRHLAFALRLLTNSVQFAIRQQDADLVERKFVSQSCSLCDQKAEADVRHCFTCSDVASVNRRRLIVAELVDLLSRAGAPPDRLDVFRSMSLLVFIRHLFDTWDKHKREDEARCLRTCFGCFSNEEFAEAMTNMRVLDCHRAWVNHDFRKLLLTFAYDEWRRRQPDENDT